MVTNTRDEQSTTSKSLLMSNQPSFVSGEEIVDTFERTVSCVIPCYNCAETISRCVKSVKAQSHPVLEIILVDDCSDDKTLALLDAFAVEDQRITVHRMSKNGGPSRARNFGWNRATGYFVAFLDADDSWHPKKLELQLRLFEHRPELEIIGHQTALEGETVGFDDNLFLNNSGLNALVTPISKASLLTRNPWSTPTVMLRRTLAFRFDEDQREAEDYLLWAQILLSGAAGLRLELPLATLYKPRFGAGGLSGNLWKMEKGELLSFRKLWRRGYIGTAEFTFASLLSLMKYFRRLLLSK